MSSPASTTRAATIHKINRIVFLRLSLGVLDLPSAYKRARSAAAIADACGRAALVAESMRWPQGLRRAGNWLLGNNDAQTRCGIRSRAVVTTGSATMGPIATRVPHPPWP